MRIIKFRAWDNGNQMIFRGLHDRNWYTEETAGKLVKPTHPDDIHFLKVMEWTGLEDKNGSNIYEGDIVLAGGIKTVVKFKMAVFILEITENKKIYTFFNFVSELDLEKIGNIYQNPDLLK